MPQPAAQTDARTAGLAVSLRAVTKVYDSGVAALGPFDLDVRKGEFVSLLGPSGCGKSTALRLIAGLSAPTSGSVGVAQRSSEPRGTHGIGFVFQEPTLMPWASVRANVRLPLKLAHVPAAEADGRVDAALKQVGLADFADAYPRELSGGMKMRASLARALVTDPDILLMDEPFAALDEITRFRLNNDLLALWRNLRKTVIFVTHSVFEFGVPVAARGGDDVAARTAQRRDPHRRGRAADRGISNLRRLRQLLPRGFQRAGAVLFRATGLMSQLQTPPLSSRRAASEPAGLRVARIVLPIVVLAAGVVAWELVVRLNHLPPYLLPGPVAVLRTLIVDWEVLFQSLLTTLQTTLEGFVAAGIGGVALALLFNRSKWLEYSLFPYAVILQVTPVIAIAPLLLIYLPQQTAVIVCAWIVAFFPVLSNTTLGLNSVDRNLTGLFQLYGASRTQTLLHLKLPSALPFILGGLRIAGGLSLIGAVVAEIAAGSAGAGSGLAYRIAEFGYRLDIPRMFAALLLLSAAGIVIYGLLALVSYLVLRRWHESALGKEN